MQRILQLHGYLDLLPYMYHSNLATKLTKVLKPFNDVDLVSHILRMVSRHWHDQYELIRMMVTQSMWKLLEVLECNEKSCLTTKECYKSHENAKGEVPQRKE